MNVRIPLLVLAFVPAAALAEVSYSRAEIVPAPRVAVAPQRLHVCDLQQGDLYARKAAIDDDHRYIDRERDAIDREAAALADELRNLNNADTAAVAAYNARSAAHNRRVADHNQYVAATNRAASLLNGDSADFLAYCNTLRLSRR